MDLSALNDEDVKAIAEGRMHDISVPALKFISGNYNSGPQETADGVRKLYSGPMPEERVSGPFGTSWKKEMPSLRDVVHREITEGHGNDANDTDKIGAHWLAPSVMGPRGMLTIDSAIGPTSVSTFKNIPSAMEVAGPNRAALAELLAKSGDKAVGVGKAAGRGLLDYAKTSAKAALVGTPIYAGLRTLSKHGLLPF